MKVALIHDDLIQFGGAERLLLALHEIWPEAPIYTSIASSEWLDLASKQNIKIVTSFMQKLPNAVSWHKYYAPTLLYLNAFESFDLSGYDLVVSSSSRFAHGVITKPGTKHVAICHSPNRAAWDFGTYLKNEKIGGVKRLLLSLASLSLSYIRLWDFTAYQRLDTIFSNSVNVKNKVKRFYLRDSVIVHPFADVLGFTSSSVEAHKSERPYYLVLSRLVSWKQIEVAIKACEGLGVDLVVAGEGPDLSRLKSISNGSTKFLGRVSENDKISLIKGCQAVLFPQSEDFGIVPVEAMACGKPVIAFAEGGALETIVPGKTGLLFAEQTPESLATTIKSFNPASFMPQDCLQRAKEFDKTIFIDRIRALIDSLYVPTN